MGMSECLVCGARVCINCGQCLGSSCPMDSCECKCVGCLYEGTPISDSSPCVRCLEE